MENEEHSGLHEYVEAEFALEGLDSPTSEKELREKLENLKGVKEISVFQDKVIVRYEPVVISEREIEAAIGGTGLKIRKANLEPSSPLANVTSEQKKTD